MADLDPEVRGREKVLGPDPHGSNLSTNHIVESGFGANYLSLSVPPKPLICKMG